MGYGFFLTAKKWSVITQNGRYGPPAFIDACLKWIPASSFLFSLTERIQPGIKEAAKLVFLSSVGHCQ